MSLVPFQTALVEITRLGTNCWPFICDLDDAIIYRPNFSSTLFSLGKKYSFAFFFYCPAQGPQTLQSNKISGGGGGVKIETAF